MATNLINEKLTQATVDRKCLSDIRRIINEAGEDPDYQKKIEAFDRISSVLICHDMISEVRNKED